MSRRGWAHAAALFLVLAPAWQPALAAHQSGYLIRPAGDLNGDGIRDVLGYRSAGSARVAAALRGTDGDVIWSRTGTDADGYPHGARVGAGGDDGVLLFGAEWIGDVVRYHHRALGEGGQVLWHASVDGATVSTATTFTRKRWPIERELAYLTSGPATDVLLDAPSEMRFGAASLYRTEALVVSGETGGVSTIAATSWGLDPAEAVATGDLSGDGRQDVLLLRRAQATIDVEAVRGTDGARLWTRTIALDGGCSGPTALGDLTGDGREDLAFSTLCPIGPPGRDSMYVLSGSDGATLWSGSQTRPRRLGDLDGDGKLEFATATEERTESDLVIKHAARRFDGSVVYETAYSMPLEPGETSSAFTDVTAVGDVDADGVTDVLHRLHVYRNPTQTDERRAVVSGRTGGGLWSVDGSGAGPQALGGSVDGSGDDLASIVPIDAESFVLRAVDGRTGEPIWESERLRSGHKFGVQMFPADLTGDGRAEIIADPHAGPSQSHTTYVLSGVDGHGLWHS